MKSRLIVNGGLGNQMFQYAFALAMRRRENHVNLDVSLYNYAKMHNGYELERVFGIKEPLINKKGFHLKWLRLLLKTKPKALLTDDPLIFGEFNLKFPKRYICGYWQDERYFKEIENEIRKRFVFQGIDKKNKAIAQEMRECSSVSVHIRRGDYAESGMLLLDDNFYSKAFEKIIDKVESPIFYIFSDDRQEAETIVSKYCSEYKVIDWNKDEDSYKDMYLISQCRHHIVANSSFSWWGAWLGNYKDNIVVAPQKWTNYSDGVEPQLKEWIKI